MSMYALNHRLITYHILRFIEILPDEVRELSRKGQILQKPKDAIKDPYILEFLGLSEDSSYSENELEQRIIEKLEHFLLELGNGFTFVTRQKRITFDEKHFWIDLVFYNRILKSFVLMENRGAYSNTSSIFSNRTWSGFSLRIT